MSEKTKTTVLIFAVIFILITVGFGAVVGKIIYLQTVEYEKWEKLSGANRSQVTYPIPARRGNIYDAQGRLLASSIPQYNLHMDTRVEALHQGGDTLFWQYVDSISEGLSRIIGDKSPEAYRQKMVSAFRGRSTREQDVRLTLTRVSYTQKKAIEQLPLICRGHYKSGIYFRDVNRRSKPFGSLGSRTIGSIYGDNGHGNAGLEKRFDKYLCGKDGESRVDRVAGHKQHIPIRDAESGADIYTTLDADLMDICESSLRKQITKNQADWGCVILMEVKTGEIKAMCNLDLDEEDGNYYESANHAVIRMEPGSTFKTVSLMAALDDGEIEITDSIEVWKKGWKYYSVSHTDAHPADTTYSIRQALAVSSNIALARIVTEGYDGSAKKFVDKLNRMGLKDSVDYIIPGAQQALITAPNDTVTISKMAYGYSVELSPLQMLMFYNGIANNGKMITPVLVKKICHGEKTIEEFEYSVIRNHMCSSSTLRDIKDCLHDVVWDNDLGTASVNPWGLRKAQSKLVSIAGKTGTAQIKGENGYSNNRHRMSFVGYFPEDKPQYSCICVIHGPRNKGYYDAGMDCGSVVRNIAEKTMAYTNEYVIKDGELVFARK
ncbi:MAG: penicillin-binding protein 2 [Paludibacteraceae bacterium]|nr:penicillin-binding protein 2 [Paludibacteraceae bacterium]